MSSAVVEVEPNNKALIGPPKRSLMEMFLCPAASIMALLLILSTVSVAMVAEMRSQIQTLSAELSRVEAATSTPRIPLPGYMPGTNDKVKLVLAQDVDYPPYAFYSAQDAEGGLAGFGHDIAQGLPEVCPHLEVTVVETKWANCWTSEGSGQGLDNAHYHGCLTYTHTSGQRNRFMEFSNAILSANKPAGILTRLNAEGKPVVSPTSDLNGVKIVDVSGWAPTADTLIYVKNSCAGDTPFNNWIMVTPPESSEPANDAALRMLMNGEADAMWLYADQAYQYDPTKHDGVSSEWDAALWTGLGQPNGFAYIHTGLEKHAINGTTLTMTNKGSGLATVVNPCIQDFMRTQSYCDLCTKHGMTSCFANDFCPSSGATTTDEKPWEDKSSSRVAGTGCSSGYCSCDAAA